MTKYRLLIERIYVTELYVEADSLEQAKQNADSILDVQELEQCNIADTEIRLIETL
jgi:hypothetical protein